jgi:HlyD family secretion protein
MFALVKKAFAIGTVGFALAMLIWGAILIRKNSPQIKETDVRFSPPTLPGSEPTLVSNATQQALANGATKAITQARYIGGIGLIEPAGEAISIGSQVPGIVTAVKVKPGDQVKKGDPLLVVDDRASQANLLVAKSNLAAQKAKLLESLGQIAPARARVESAQAMVDQSKASRFNAKQELARAEKLGDNNSMSMQELELSRLNVLLADSRVMEAEANLRDAQGKLDLLAGKDSAPSILVQQAAVDQASAQVAKEEVELQLRTILAPIDATVLQVKIRAGEFAPAAILDTPLMVLGVTNPLHIRVDIDESEIPRFQPNAKAWASVRGRPEVKVALDFVRIEPYVIPKKTLNGGVSERVDTRVLQIIYSVLPTQIEAITGQQVDVYIEECAR